MASVLLKVEDLSVRFKTGGVWGRGATIQALEHVSLQIERGARFGIVGESGSGKSTLARTIVGLVAPTSGKVYFEGEIIRAPGLKLKPLPTQIQIVFQDPFGSLDPGQRVFDIMKEPLKVNRLYQSESVSDKRIIEIFQKIGLSEELLRRYPHELSGGQRQRVSIARAVMLKPKLLILDEPTSALDVSTQAQIVQLIQELAREYNFTYVFITHNLELAWYMCDKICVMQRGRVVEMNDRDQIFENPTTEYTRQLIHAATVKV